MRRFIPFVWVLVGMAACSDSDPGAGDASGTFDAAVDSGAVIDLGEIDAPMIPGLLGLRIEPSSQTLTDDGVAPGATTTFTAIGTFSDGERDVSGTVTWLLSEPRLGAITGGAFVGASVGGTTQVFAQAGSTRASASLTVVLQATRIDGDAPDDAASYFESDPSGDVLDASGGPHIVYPSHETMFPLNLGRILNQWDASDNFDLFEVRIDSPTSHLRFYTTAQSYEVDDAAWSWLAASNAGGAVTMSVRGVLRSAPSTIARSQDVTLYFSASEVIGALYYWSTAAAGVMRATIDAPLATKFYTDPDSGDSTCVACHTVSRDGRRLAVNYGGERLRLVTVPDRELRVPATASERGPDYGWGTFNPGATTLVYSSKSDRSEAGVLHQMDVETGVRGDDIALPTGHWATQPDWSPNGRYIVFAYASARTDNKRVTGSSIARIAVNDDGTYGEPEVLCESEGEEDTLFFPTYSPDSHWIAFVRAEGASKDNVTATIYLMPAEGCADGAPVALTRLNRRVRDEDDVMSIGNSMPTWAPSTRPEVNWLAFSSIRAYGNVLAQGAHDQIWGVAVDLSDEVSPGDDRSFAAFWFPFQGTDEGNHRAFWALNPDDPCPSNEEICDDLDNDCDGIVDEDCCVPAEEICDEVDNDCDGVVDEGCDCVPTENCINGIDDDCDTLIDEADEDCLL